jgi:hypothetical protein
MTELKAENDSGWKQFLRKHWGAVAVFVAAGIVAIIGAGGVFLWFVGQAQTTGLVPSSLGAWSMGNWSCVILHAIFWTPFVGSAIHAQSPGGYGGKDSLRREKRCRSLGRVTFKPGRRSNIGSLLFIAFASKCS